MLTWIRKLLAAPVFEDEDKTRAADLLNTILLTIFVATVVGSLIMILVEPTDIAFSTVFGLIMGAITLGLWLLMRHGHVQMASVLLSSALWVGTAGLALNSRSGIRDPSATTYFLVITVAGLLLGGRAVIVFGLLSILAMIGVFYIEISGLIAFPFPIPIGPVDLIVLFMTFGLTALLLRSAVRSIAEGFGHARRSAQALAESNRELQASRDALQAQTRELERRAHYLEATATVARDAASVLDLRELLSRVATLVSEQFGFYHTGLFLLDESSEWAVLQAASSGGGRRMLARGHRLRVGVEGIVGYVTGRGEPRIALDVGRDAVFFDNPDLPETRSEMALPLRARGEIIGALDVQSQEPEAFSKEDVAVLQTLADQVAMAISNARLFLQAQESLEAERQAYGELSRQAWAEMVRARPYLGYRYEEGDVASLAERPTSQGKQGGDGDELPKLALPVRVRGQVIGTINAHKPSDTGEWTVEEVTLMQALTDQLSVALESARLYQDTQRRAARERLTGQVTARIRQTLDMETVLETAVREIVEALGLAALDVRLGTETELTSGDGG